MLRNLGTLDALTGILTIIDAHAVASGSSRAKILARAGLVQNDWDTLSTALSSVGSTNLMNLVAAAGLMLMVGESPVRPEVSAGVVAGTSDGKRAPGAYGPKS